MKFNKYTIINGLGNVMSATLIKDNEKTLKLKWLDTPTDSYCTNIFNKSTKLNRFGACYYKVINDHVDTAWINNLIKGDNNVSGILNMGGFTTAYNMLMFIGCTQDLMREGKLRQYAEDRPRFFIGDDEKGFVVTINYCSDSEGNLTHIELLKDKIINKFRIVYIIPSRTRNISGEYSSTPMPFFEASKLTEQLNKLEANEDKTYYIKEVE